MAAVNRPPARSSRRSLTTPEHAPSHMRESLSDPRDAGKGQLVWQRVPERKNRCNHATRAQSSRRVSLQTQLVFNQRGVQQLVAISMDMGPGYAKSARKHAPQAVICIDNFHVVQLATKALDDVRREHWNELRSTGESEAAKSFKDARFSLLKNPEDLTERQIETLAALHAAGGKLPRAYTLKEMVRAIFAAGLSEHTVSQLIDRLLSRLSRSRLEPFVRLGRTIRKHREGILSARRLKLSNARAEALNNKVKLIVRRAYGFHSANAALALIHLTCGPVTLTLPHERPAT